MDKQMQRTVLIMTWATFLIIGLVITGANLYRQQRNTANTERDNHIRSMGKACNERVHNLYSPSTGERSAYGTLDFHTAYTLELEAKKECIINYPLPY